jgi:pseudouridine kinase
MVDLPARVPSTVNHGAVNDKAVNHGAPKHPAIVVLGGANLDIKSRITGKNVPGTSNPGETRTSPGGVARNIAENLARLGGKASLFSVVGDDAIGDRLRREARMAGIDTALLQWRRGITGSYCAVLDTKGELLVAVSDMHLIDSLKASDITRHKDVLGAADLLVADANLPPACLIALARLAARAKVPLVIDPVSVPKAKRLVELLKLKLPIMALTPNRDELAVLAGIPVKTAPDLARAARRLHDMGVVHVLVGLGAAGCFVSSDDGSQHKIPSKGTGGVKDVTGGGDAMVAGFALGLAAGNKALRAARTGQELAARAVRSEESVAAVARPRKRS